MLTTSNLVKIQTQLNNGDNLSQVAIHLELKLDTLRKAAKSGLITIPVIENLIGSEGHTKSERIVIDDAQNMGKACTNSIERVLASKAGTSCKVDFSNQTDLQNAGSLLAIPSLLGQGLLRYEDDFKLDNGYYPTASIFVSLAILSLLRVKTLSGVESIPSGELGRAIGLDRIPEVKTLRGRIAKFSESTDITKWRLSLSKDWMEADPELSAVLYIDGHIKLYYGKTKTPPKRFVSRMRLCLSGTTDYWVNDMLGQPFFVVNKTISQGLIDSINADFLVHFDQDIPNQPSAEELLENKKLSRYMLVFDREGYSPNFFYDLWQKRISICTYKKNVTDKWDDDEFSMHTGALSFGAEQQIELAERGVLLQNKGSNKKIWAREIRKKSKSGHQTSIITTNFILSSIIIGLYMFARWSQENFFKYMMENFGIDSLTSYFKEKISDTSLLINPEHRQLEYQRKKLTSKLTRVKSNFASIILENVPIEKKEMETYIAKKDELKSEIEHIEQEVKDVKEKKKGVPRKITYGELPENDKFNNVINQRKHFLDTIKLISYRAETSMSNSIKQWMGHSDESRMLLKQIYKADANIKVDKINNLLTVEIHNLAHFKDDKILQKLCAILNETQTKFPDTNLVLFYKLASG